MKRIIPLLFFALLFSANAFAHQAFTLVSSEKKTIKEADLAGLEKTGTVGKIDKTNLTFTEKEIRLVVLTGPEDDMLSYRIQGLRNPNLIIPIGATLRILFVNVDIDMRHDIRFGHVEQPFPIAPDIAETAGTAKLEKRSEEGVLQAEEVVIKAGTKGQYVYICSVRGHAKGGMWGNIAVGVPLGKDTKTPEKIEHVHSEEEEEGHDHDTDKKTDTNKKTDTPKKKPGEEMSEMKPATEDSKTEKKSDMSGMNHGQHGDDKTEMRSTVNIGDPMTREGSGTSWLPDSSPMYAYMKMYKDGGMLMLHGNMFFRYTSVGSKRNVSVAGKGSRSRFDAPSMFMAMYSKPINEKSQIGLRAMVSLDPIIERGYGYPLLYQSGELYRGRPIHDRQHPHDFFSELSASYSYKFNEKSSMYFYAGYPGEPALGPVAFMHRPSAMNNPDAPIGHHWQDASHITFGVLTAGYVYDKVKFEASAFNGTEPDENRWNFDAPRLNSFSGRFSFNPTKEWAFQVSYGYLRNPERSEPDLKVLRRTTASAMFHKKLDENRNWSNSLVWGQNHSDEGRNNAFLFESNYEFDKNSIFGRFEQVQKNSHELVLPAPHPEGDFWVGAYSLGYLREIFKDKGLDLGIGGVATFNTNPSIISSFYGGTKHGGWQFFIRLRPSKMKHD
ncbi:MAG TPA: sulfocyanin-like copper-binding protein [Pyrinomonadaceae bacterium]